MAMAKVGAKAAAARNSGAQEVPESLDKVRDILFGAQMRTVEERLQDLEQRLLAELGALRSEFEKRSAQTSAAVERRLTALAESLESERGKRGEEVKAARQESREKAKQLDSDVAAVKKMLAEGDAAQRDQLQTTAKQLALELKQSSAELRAEVGARLAELQRDKADLSSVAEILTEMARRLGGGPAPAAK